MKAGLIGLGTLLIILLSAMAYVAGQQEPLVPAADLTLNPIPSATTSSPVVTITPTTETTPETTSPEPTPTTTSPTPTKTTAKPKTTTSQPTSSPATTTPALTPTATETTTTSTPTPTATSVSILANDNTADVTSLSVAAGTPVTLTIRVDEQNTYYGGLQFKSTDGSLDSGPISPGATKTLSFTANETITLQPYWPASGTKKPYTIKINVD